MILTFEERPSDSPFIERVWRSWSATAGSFLSIASIHCEMVVTRCRGDVFLTLRGPETKATFAQCPADGEWIGVRFRLGTFVPHLLPGNLSDRRDVTLPGATTESFWLRGSAWEYPTFSNAETFVARLARQGLIVRNPIVDRVLDRRPHLVSLRTSQRRFLQATGLTHRAVRQIERARHATFLLTQGTSILDTVHEAGYFDQAHLTRSLKHLVGQTPGEIVQATAQLSFLYKTTPRASPYDAVSVTAASAPRGDAA
jgi:AraC-like DNA-binding protein